MIVAELRKAIEKIPDDTIVDVFTEHDCGEATHVSYRQTKPVVVDGNTLYPGGPRLFIAVFDWVCDGEGEIIAA